MKTEAGAHSEHTVPESLLAMAKDARYVAACTKLVQQVLVGFQTSDNTTTAGQQQQSDDEQISAKASLISSALYILLVLALRKKTLGMEATGLEYALQHGQHRWKLFLAISLATAVASTCCTLSIQQQRPSTVEALHGQSRRDIFQAQRRAMLERAASSSLQQTDEAAPGQRQRSGTAATTSSIDLVERIKSLLSNCIKTSIQCLSTHAEEPHRIHQANSTTTYSMAAWLVRLHLATYCLNGQYATWMHRLVLGSSHKRESEQLINRPTYVRLLGLLIWTEAAGTAVQAVSRAVVRYCVDSYSSTTTMNSTEGEVNRPSIEFVGTTNRNDDESAATCDICHQPRKSPACPVNCGHVFCWSCLLQWVTTVRPECPLCRTACRPQDILALHQYS